MISALLAILVIVDVVLLVLITALAWQIARAFRDMAAGIRDLLGQAFQEPGALTSSSAAFGPGAFQPLDGSVEPAGATDTSIPPPIRDSEALAATDSLLGAAL